MTNRDDAHKSNATYFGGEIMPLQEGGKKKFNSGIGERTTVKCQLNEG